MRERILSAAREELAYRGLKFSIRELIARLGISSKTLYQYFASKEELVTALTLAEIEEMKRRELEIREDPSLSVAEKLREALLVLPGSLAAKDFRLLDDLRRSYPEAWGHAERYLIEGWRGVEQLVAEGVREGTIRRFDLDLLIQMYVGSMYRLLETRSEHMTSGEALRNMVDILLDGIRLKN